MTSGVEFGRAELTNFIFFEKGTTNSKPLFNVAPSRGTLDVLWSQPIKLAQMASTSELQENQQNDLLFFEIVFCHYRGASEVQTQNYFAF